MQKRIIICALVAVWITGCSGQLTMTKIKPQDLLNDTTLHGVVIYQPAWFVELSLYTKLVDENGKVTGAPCEPTDTKIYKIALHGDMNHPMLLNYEHGMLEAYTFGATLGDDWVLKSVSTESTPDRGTTIANLGTAASSFAAAALAPKPGKELQKCNAEPVLVGLKRYPFPSD